jgi:hypothetical protein
MLKRGDNIGTVTASLLVGFSLGSCFLLMIILGAVPLILLLFVASGVFIGGDADPYFPTWPSLLRSVEIAVIISLLQVYIAIFCARYLLQYGREHQAA